MVARLRLLLFAGWMHAQIVRLLLLPPQQPVYQPPPQQQAGADAAGGAGAGAAAGVDAGGCERWAPGALTYSTRSWRAEAPWSPSSTSSSSPSKSSISLKKAATRFAGGVHPGASEPAPRVDHSRIEYRDFNRDFYVEAPDVSSMDADAVEAPRLRALTQWWPPRSSYCWRSPAFSTAQSLGTHADVARAGQARMPAPPPRGSTDP